MPGFGDTTFIVLLALLLFGPKKLPVLARQLGKLMADFRRASNEFRTQMEEELRIAEQADRQKQIAAMEAAAPKPVEVIPEPEHPHLPPPPSHDDPMAIADPASAHAVLTTSHVPTPAVEDVTAPAAESTPEPLPIASSGSLNLMPPSTGLPVPNTPYTPPVESAPVPPDRSSGHHFESNGKHHESTPEESIPETEPAEARPWMT